MAPPSGAVPPSLPPSVEEAYRRKCIQLKQRMNEVEDANDASRQRIVRMERSIQKMRLERAFLLEQLSKRTSTNVEDSEGSPSPPPTPKEKPLRTKRGHRKPSFLTNLADARSGTTFIPQGPVAISPSSDAFSHSNMESTIHASVPPVAAKSATSKRHLAANGRANPSSRTASPKRVRNAFEVYCSDMRPILTVDNRKAIADGSFDVEKALAVGWQDIDEDQRAAFQRRYEESKKLAEPEKGSEASKTAAGIDGESKPAEEGDEDVEMADDGESAAGDAGGFTAVNRG